MKPKKNAKKMKRMRKIPKSQKEKVYLRLTMKRKIMMMSLRSSMMFFIILRI
jgi:hypothetical protein